MLTESRGSATVRCENFYTSARRNQMDFNDLKEVLQKLEAKGIPLEKASEEIKVSEQLLHLYSVGGLVPDRIINNLNKLLETDEAA
jgi:hypothetical protein